MHTDGTQRGKPALEGRMCHACRGTRLVTDPTGTVHARGSEMKISGLLHRGMGASTRGTVFYDAIQRLIASMLRLARNIRCEPFNLHSIR